MKLFNSFYSQHNENKITYLVTNVTNVQISTAEQSRARTGIKLKTQQEQLACQLMSLSVSDVFENFLSWGLLPSRRPGGFNAWSDL